MTNQQIATAIEQRRIGFTWAGLARRYVVTEPALMRSVADYHRAKLRAQSHRNAHNRRRALAARNRTIRDLLREGVRVATIAQNCGLSERTIRKIQATLNPRASK